MVTGRTARLTAECVTSPCEWDIKNEREAKGEKGSRIEIRNAPLNFPMLLSPILSAFLGRGG